MTLVRILTKIMENAHLVRKRSEFWTQVRNFENLVKMLEKHHFFARNLFVFYLREAHGNKTLVSLRARRASTPSPQGEVYEPFRASR